MRPRMDFARSPKRSRVSVPNRWLLGRLVAAGPPNPLPTPRSRDRALVGVQGSSACAPTIGNGLAYDGQVTTADGKSESAAHEGTIADPGNAQCAITVGSAHRDMPHTYGVSYFSAKGPTADGRMKPDIVAPGERIVSCARMVDTAGDATVIPFREDSGTRPSIP
jgi:hypothetical protein